MYYCNNLVFGLKNNENNAQATASTAMARKKVKAVPILMAFMAMVCSNNCEVSNSWSKISLVTKLNDLEKDISPFDPRLGNVLPNIYLKPYEHELGENQTITCHELYKNQKMV